MKNEATPTTTAPTVTAQGVWINPYTGREMGATLDDLIKAMKEKQSKEKVK